MKNWINLLLFYFVIPSWIHMMLLSFISLFFMFSLIMGLKDGIFIHERWGNGYVIKMFDKKGPKQCLKLCSRHKNCNAINYLTEHLLCELLRISYAVNNLEIRQGSMFSLLDTWTMVSYTPLIKLRCSNLT